MGLVLYIFINAFIITFFKEKKVTPLESGFVVPNSPPENTQHVSCWKP